MTTLTSILELVFQNECLSIVDLLNIEKTSSSFQKDFKFKCRKSKSTTTKKTYECDKIVESMASCIQVDKSTASNMIWSIMKGKCFISGSTLLSSLTDKSFHKADIDLYVVYPADDSEQEELHQNITALVHVMGTHGFQLPTMEDIEEANTAEYQIAQIKERNCREREHYYRLNHGSKVHVTRGILEYDSSRLLHIITLTKEIVNADGILQTYKLQLMIITTHYGIDEVTRSFDLTICSSYYCFSEDLNPDQMSSEQLVVPYLDDITSQVMKITPGYIQQDIFHNNLVVENISRIHKYIDRGFVYYNLKTTLAIQDKSFDLKDVLFKALDNPSTVYYCNDWPFNVFVDDNHLEWFLSYVIAPKFVNFMLDSKPHLCYIDLTEEEVFSKIIHITHNKIITHLEN